MDDTEDWLCIDSINIRTLGGRLEQPGCPLNVSKVLGSAIMVLEGGVGSAGLKQASRKYGRYLETDKDY